MSQDIAIIGIAGRFPDAENLTQFHENLAAGKDSVTPLSDERRSATALPWNVPYKPAAFIDHIDRFDFRYFQISRLEAEYMDPHQRILLETVQETIDTAGYANEALKGSKTAVIVGDTHQEYYKLADQFDPMLLTGNSDSSTAGRIARFFGCHGMATMVDTACSSGLLAIHLACKEINSGDAEQAIAAGIRLLVIPDKEETSVDMGILSNDGKTRSFSTEAQGTGIGEAAVAVLLKPLEKAQADDDYIFGVIAATATNQDADRSGSLTAPSAEAQSEVLRAAWQKAAVKGTDLAFIETHGSGTQLGDPIEVAGIDGAFGSERPTPKKHISSVKTNIGHTGNAAGITGFAKAILALNHKCLYPSLHFTEPNPLIPFHQSAVQVTTEYQNWPDNQDLTAGVSSFGLSGTNVHAVVKAYNNQRTSDETGQLYFFPISGKTKEALADNLNRFKDFVKHTVYGLQDISFTLCQGRTHHSYRAAFVADSKAQLLQALENYAGPSTQLQEPQPLFLFSGDTEANALWGKNTFGTQLSGQNDRELALQTQLQVVQSLQHYGIDTEAYVGIGIGDLSVAVLLDELSLAEANQEECPDVPENIEERLKKMIQRQTLDEDLALFVIGSPSGIEETLLDIKKQHADWPFEVCMGTHVLDLLKPWYEMGGNIAWKPFAQDYTGQRVPLPTYAFQRSRCWIKEATVPTDSTATPNITPENELPKTQPDTTFTIKEGLIPDAWTDTQKTVARAWIKGLKLDEISLDDDFFKLGGHSLIAIKIIGELEQELNIKLAFQNAFAFATIRNFAAAIDELKQHGSKQIGLQKATPRDVYPLAHAQKRLWLLQQANPGATAYNLPSAMELTGPLDLNKVKATWQQLVNRHEALRLAFHEVDGVVIQKVSPTFDFKLTPVNATSDDPNTLVKAFVQPFDLTKAPLLRVGVVPVAPQNHLLLFDMHHIISDGISLANIAREFVLLYSGETLTPLTYQYTDYTTWEQESFDAGNMAEHRDFWVQRMENIQPLNLPTDFPRDAQSAKQFKGASIWLDIPVTLLNQLTELGKSQGATLYMTLLSAYQVLLHKYTGATDVVVGSPIAGRIHPETQPMVGMFVNTLAMRHTPSGELSFTHFLNQVKEEVREALQHQIYPFDSLVDDVKADWKNGRNPLFDTLFVLQNIPTPEERFGDLEVQPVPFENTTALFDITFEVNQKDDGDAPLQIMYRTDLFEAATIELMGRRWMALLESIVQSPEQSLAGLSWEIAADYQENTTEFDFDIEL